jgi:glycosyltransferase involved in cell wall biosynthesis
MKLVIDLQGAQTLGSRHRGIGRYTLALVKAIIRNRGDHEVVLLLNGLFHDTISPLTDEFVPLLPASNIIVWQAPPRVAFCHPFSKYRRISAELIREHLIQAIAPDIVLITSLFEGHGDDSITSIGRIPCGIPTAVILYDLIPFIRKTPYLDNPSVQEWYLSKVDFLRKSQLCLAISESSRQEAIDHLNYPEHDVVTISSDADPQFRRIEIDLAFAKKLLSKYGINHKFLMYTGGIDHRKNIEGLIAAYAKLNSCVRASLQLVIVCSVPEEVANALTSYASNLGLQSHELVFTGFVSEQELIYLYNLCYLFVFPSFHEGFGLPVLEAMRCGAPVIASNLSSLPEVVGNIDALFDPYSSDDLCELMLRALSDNQLLQQFVEHGDKHAAKFSWDYSAKIAIKALEAKVKLPTAKQPGDQASRQPRKPRLAYISPLPPDQSGIADYSAELVPALSSYYEITLIVPDEKRIVLINKTEDLQIRSADWFRSNAQSFDRILYHIGNSSLHAYMFGLAMRHPGVIVLHDVYLSGVMNYMEVSGLDQALFRGELFASHGIEAVRELRSTGDRSYAILNYPCSSGIISDSLGVIVHSEYSLQLAKASSTKDSHCFRKIPLVRNISKTVDRYKARESLGLPHDAVVVCSFGFLASQKLNDRLLRAWNASSLARDVNCYLIFVGQLADSPHSKTLPELIGISPAPDRISITGWVDQEVYRQYLQCADIAVQLRGASRGETSAAVYDCMGYGLPLIANANGSMRDLDQDAVLLIPDQFADDQLVAALERLCSDSSLRSQLAQRGSDIVSTHHSPSSCAKQYHVAIEYFYQAGDHSCLALINAIAESAGQPETDGDILSVSKAIASNTWL